MRPSIARGSWQAASRLDAWQTIQPVIGISWKPCSSCAFRAGCMPAHNTEREHPAPGRNRISKGRNHNRIAMTRHSAASGASYHNQQHLCSRRDQATLLQRAVSPNSPALSALGQVGWFRSSAGTRAVSGNWVSLTALDKWPTQPAILAVPSSAQAAQCPGNGQQ